LAWALKRTHENLRACQATIHLCGELDPAYVTAARATMKIADAALAKDKQQPPFAYPQPHPKRRGAWGADQEALVR
jgi:hypothetical protein